MFGTLTTSNAKCAKCGTVLGPTGCFTVIGHETFHAACAPAMPNPMAGEVATLKALLKDAYWPLANIRRFDPNGDERYPHAHPDLLEKIRVVLVDGIPPRPVR